MTIVNQLVKRLLAIHELNEQIKTAEKAKIPALKQDASDLFNMCYEDFKSSQGVVNNLKSGTKEHGELHVMLAEAAFYTENFAICRSVIERYLQPSPQFDQFYCRCKLTLALVINEESKTLNGMESIRYHKLAVAEVMKALDVATMPNNLARYKFLVFNVSVAFWKIVNAYLRAERAKFFTAEISRVVSALETQDDPDKDWRIMYLSAAAVCCEDDKKSKEAVDYVDKAVEHAEGLLAVTVAEEDKIAAANKVASTKLEEIMNAFRKIEEREILLNKPPRIDPDLPEDHVYEKPNPPPLEGLAAQGYDHVKEMLDESQRTKAASDAKLNLVTEKKTRQQATLANLYMQRIFLNPSDSKRYSALPPIVKYLRSSTLVQLQCMICGCIPDKEWELTFNQLIKKLTDTPSSTLRNETLLDVCRVAWRLKLRDIAMKCFTIVQAENTVSPVIRVKLDACDAIKQLADLDTESVNTLANSRLSAKQADGFRVSRRIEAIKLLERTVLMCNARLEDKFLAQEICIVMWNACIPLLQPHLRMKIYSSLKCITTTLESVSSPLSVLRMQAHFEVAKCEEQSDFVVLAKNEGQSALNSDYGALGDVNAPSTLTTENPIVVELDRNRPMDQIVQPFVSVLELRSSVFNTPSDVEGNVLLWLQQAKESKSKPVVVDMITKSLYMMTEDLPELRAAKETASQTGGSVSVDFSILLLQKGPITIAEVPLEDISNVLRIPRSGQLASAQTFTKEIQTRCMIMTTIAKLAHATQCINILQQAALYVLSFTWDTQDPLLFSLVDAQIEVYYLLADSLLWRITLFPFKPAAVDAFAGEVDPESDEFRLKSMDPRTLGLRSDIASPEMLMIKQQVILALDKGIQLSVALKDTIGIQNGIIYFWNLHLHIFRTSSYYLIAMEDVFELLKSITVTLDTVKTFPSPPADPSLNFDDRIKIGVYESMAGFLEARKQIPAALEYATKGATTPTNVEYVRRKICEQASRLTLVQATSGAPVKGGKGGGGAEPPKYDNPLLSVYAMLTQAEQPVEMMPRENSLALVEKTVAMMETEVATYLTSQKWRELTQERYAQLVEMQAECWCRLTRMRILFGDVIGSQYTAEKCLALVNKDNLSEADAVALSTRVWRWISVCERLFGIAITNIIQPEGQDATLQNELRLVALSHLVIATNYGIRAKNEELVVNAATNAWNIVIPLIEVNELRDRLFAFQRVIVDNLLLCKGVTLQKQVMLLRQQFYMAMIEGYANIFNWDKALSMVMEAFDYVSSDLQKPLWQWRVIAMSKKGKNVLDGLQKLKENDPSLQAMVFIILARSSNNPKQQLESYLKAIEILHEDMERVDYMLEVAQWMSTSGIPRADISEMLLTAMDALYEVEEKCMPEIADMDEDEALHQFNVGASGLLNDNASKSGAGSKAGSKSSRRPSLKSGSRGTSRRGSVTAKSKAAGSVVASKKTSVRGEPPPVDHVPDRLNFKMIEQCSRGLVMLSLLDSKVEGKVDKHIEAVYFVRKGMQLWFDVLREMFRKSAYVALADDVKASTDFETYEVKFPDYLTVPEEPILLLPWINTHQKALIVLMQQAIAQWPLEVPSAKSLPCVSVTVHYMLLLSQSLFDEGYCKYSLLVLGYLRLLLLTATPIVEGYESVLVFIHLRTVRVLMSLGLTEEANQLSHIVVGTATDTPNLSITHYLTEYCRKAAINSTKTSNIKKMEKLADYTSPFGISTWTHQMDGKLIDPPMMMLNICDTLLELGQVSLCQNVVLTIQKEFVARDSPRAVLQCSTLMCRIHFFNGRYQTVVATALAMRPTLSQVGDAAQFSEQTQLLVRSYLKLGNIDEARQVGTYSLQLVEDATQKNIDKKALKSQAESNATLKGGTQSQVTLGSSVVVSHNASVASRSSKKTVEGASKIVVEASYENTQALAALTTCFVEVLLASARAAMAEYVDPRPLYVEMCERLSRCNDIITDVAGPGTELSAQVLTTRALVAVEFLGNLHETVSGLISVDMYSNWLYDNMLMCSEYLEKVVASRKALINSIPATEGQYTSEAIIAKSVESTKDGVASILPYKVVSLPLNRSLALSELHLANVQVILATLKSKHQSPTIFRDRPVLTVEQQYLEDTKPPADHDLVDFLVQPLTVASQWSSAAAQLLAGTDSAIDSTLVFSLSQLMLYCNEGKYDAMWQPPADVNNANAVVHVMTHEAETRRAELKAATQAAIKASRFSYAKTSCAALVEAFGANSPGPAACWLMQLQSLYARDWLTTVWLDVLNPASEISASFARLQALQKESWPSAAALKQIEAEKSFLKTSSVCYKRLSVSQDPLTILNTILPTSTIVLCLQFCPLKETLYVCAGTKSGGVAAAPAAAGGKPAPAPAKVASVDMSAAAGAELDAKLWVLDKIKLTEANRRALQVIRQQHASWTADVTKFIAIYGESTSPDFDVEGSVSNFESKTLKKAEHALDERLRALIADMEALFVGLLGPTSRLVGYLTSTTALMTKPALLLLLDASLQSLPWEAMQFTDSFEGRTSRDFSLHMFYHRTQTLCGNPVDPALPFVVPPLVNLNASGMKYIVDPLSEDLNGNKTEGFKRDALVTTVADMIQKNEIAGGGKWIKVRDKNGIVSLQDWTVSVDHASLKPPAAAGAPAAAAAPTGAPPAPVGLFLYALGRFGSLLSPNEMVALNLERLALYVGCDYSHNDTSFRRQNSVDVLKKGKEIESEQSLNVAAAMALSGAGAQFIHLWSTPIVAQNRLTSLFWKSFTTKKDRLVLSVADTVNAAGAAPGTKGASIKKWIRCSRVLYGLPNIGYTDA